MMIRVGVGISRAERGPALGRAPLKLRSPIPEFLLMAAACCWPANVEEIQSALTSEIDWKRFLAVVAKHRVAALVTSTLFSTAWQEVPDEVKNELNHLTRGHVMQAAVLTREASALLERLSQGGVSAGVLKGSAIGVLAFGDATLRHVRDIDLLVLPDDVPIAHEVLLAAGYRLSSAEGSASLAIRKSMAESKHLAYSHSVSQIHVELHWRLYDNPYFDSTASTAWIFENAEAAFGVTLRTLPQSELLPYLCGHGGLHGWSRLKWLADIAAIFRASPLTIEPLMKRAANEPLWFAVVQAVVLSHVLFGTHLPKQLERLSWRERFLVRSAWDAMVRSNASTEPQADRFSLLRTRLATFLLSARPAYFLSQLRVELMADDPGPSNLTRSRWKAPFRRTARWFLGKLLPSRQRHTGY